MQKYNFKDVPLDDPKVWYTYQRGDVKGIFQVESQLCKEWCRKIKPSNIDELSALISLVRPGGLESGFAEKYANIKHGKEDISYLHPALKPALSSTYSCLVFQEQILRICIDIAGFDEIQADNARRAVGKKLPEEMVQVKKEFLAGAKKKGIVTEEVAEEIFSWIQKSVRYLFNACLTEDAYVETPEGLKSIKDLKPKDKVLAPSDLDESNEYVDVVQVYQNGNKEVFEIQLESGKKIQSTSDHQFVCEDGEKRTLFEIIEKNYKIMCED